MTKKNVLDLTDNQVLGVYAPETNPHESLNVENSLAFHNRPFMADLEPVSLTERIDFDPVTLLPVGVALVVKDIEDNEHIVRYVSVQPAQILSENEAAEVFDQLVPENVADESLDQIGTVEMLTSKEEVIDSVSYDLYELAPSKWEMLSISMLKSSHPSPYYKPLSIVPEMTFRSITDQEVIAEFYQGPSEVVKDILLQTPASWYESETFELAVGNDTKEGWIMEGFNDDRWITIVESDETLFYIVVHNSTRQQALDAISSLQLIPD